MVAILMLTYLKGRPSLASRRGGDFVRIFVWSCVSWHTPGKLISNCQSKTQGSLRRTEQHVWVMS